MNSTQDKPGSIVPTGLQGLDTILGGGIPLGSLVMLVGEPGTGKTTLLQQLCFNWADRSSSSSLSQTNLLDKSTSPAAKGKAKPERASNN